MPGEMCRNCAICGLGRPRFARRKISISRSESVEFGLDEQVEQQHVRACPAQQCSHISAAPRLGHQLDAGSLIQQCAQGDGDVWMVSTTAIWIMFTLSLMIGMLMSFYSERVKKSIVIIYHDTVIVQRDGDNNRDVTRAYGKSCQKVVSRRARSRKGEIMLQGENLTLTLPRR